MIDYLSELNCKNKKIVIVKLHDRYGPTIIEDFDAIVVSPETKPIAKEINKIRNDKHLKKLKIYTIPFEIAYDYIPISSTRIKMKKIDKEGNPILKI